MYKYIIYIIYIELVDACKKADFSDIIILNETRGQPDGK